MAKKRRVKQPQAKGFRPGKEPTHLKKRRAKAQLGSDASWSQKQAIDAIAGRRPEEVRSMVKRWSTGLFAGGLLLGAGGLFLYGWSTPAGIVTHVVAGLMLFLGYRVKKSGQGLADMASSI
ncbi:MAG: hypothetical protein P8L45_01015 [Longimicrobiales bacterium]|nr:hypothetical protein [Longimicrobiales bacterium]